MSSRTRIASRGSAPSSLWSRSTKALSGHSLGATGVHEAIYCLLMMRDGFIAGSAHIEGLDPRAEAFPIVRAARDVRLRTVMSNSFGFGGNNATLVFARE